MKLRIPQRWLWIFLAASAVTLGTALAVRTTLQQMADRRDLRRYPGILAGTGRLPAFVLAVSGPVEFQLPGSDEWLQVTDTSVIVEGAKVRTREGGRVQLAVEDISVAEDDRAGNVTFTLQQHSELALVGTQGGRAGETLKVQARLISGNIDVSSDVKGTGGGLEIETNRGMLQGGQFSAQLNATTPEGAVAMVSGAAQLTQAVEGPLPGVSSTAAVEGAGASPEEGGQALLTVEQEEAERDRRGMITVKFGLLPPGGAARPGDPQEDMQHVLQDSLNRYVRGLQQGQVGPLTRLLTDPIEQDRSPYNLAEVRARVSSAELSLRVPGSGGGRTWTVKLQRAEHQWQVDSIDNR